MLVGVRLEVLKEMFKHKKPVCIIAGIVGKKPLEIEGENTE